MLVGILAVQGGVSEHEEMLDRLGVAHRQIRNPSHLEGINALILPGGESTAISKLLELMDLLEPMRAMLHAGLPVYGTCAGMILLATEVLDTRPDAHSFGVIDMTVRRNAFGSQVDSFESDLTVTGVDGPVNAVFIRAPWVERTGEGVEVLASIDSGRAAGAIVAVRHGAAWATSFHPECTDDERIHSAFIASARAAGLCAHADGSVTATTLDEDPS